MGRPKPIARRKRIKELMAEHSYAIKELMAITGVSRSAIRRDLADLGISTPRYPYDYSEHIQFRLSPADLGEFRANCESLGKPMAQVLREWIIIANKKMRRSIETVQ